MAIQNQVGTIPFNITLGGTGAITAPAALTNLGAVPVAGGSMTGPLILSADPSAALGAATKQYVDAISSGLSVKTPCYTGTTANLTATYNNGASGVGATLTNSGALTTFSADGISPPINSRILVKSQSSVANNGIYVLTTVGSGAIAWVLTRATDYDSTAEINPGDFILIQNGATLASTGWIQVDVVTTVGTNPIDFSQFGNQGTVTSVAASTNSSTALAISGSPINSAGVLAFTVGAELVGLAGLSAVGFVSRTGAGTYTSRTITGTTNLIDITNGDGIAGNPTVTIANNAILPGMGGVTLPTGTTVQQAGAAGTIRFNSQTLVFEGTANGSTWLPFSNSSGTVTAVTGTTNRITSSGGTTPVIDISSSYVGQTSITTLGTLTTGTLGTGFTIVSPAVGGTGINNGARTITIAGNLSTIGAFTAALTFTANTAVTFPTSGTLATTAGTVTSVTGTTDRITSSGGTTPVIDIAATYVGQTSIVTLGTVTTGTWTATNIALNKGGTNAALSASNGGIFYSTASAGAILAGTATVRQMLQSGASAAPTWSTTTWPATSTINQILYSSSANVVAGLTTANNGILITSGAGIPSISSTLPNLVQDNITRLGTISVPVAFTDPANSGSAGTGAVVFTGGIGVGKNLWLGGNSAGCGWALGSIAFGLTNFASIQNSSLSAAVSTNYALGQTTSGNTSINASSGQKVFIRVNDTVVAEYGSLFSTIYQGTEFLSDCIAVTTGVQQGSYMIRSDITTKTITTGANTVVTFNTNTVSSGVTYVGGSFTANKDGLYMATYDLNWVPTGGGGVYLSWIDMPGSSANDRRGLAQISPSQFYMSGSAAISLNSGDSIRFMVFQTTGVNQSLTTAHGSLTFMGKR